VRERLQCKVIWPQLRQLLLWLLLRPLLLPTLRRLLLLWLLLWRCVVGLHPYVQVI
jgi:hypothetical protein